MNTYKLRPRALMSLPLVCMAFTPAVSRAGIFSSFSYDQYADVTGPQNEIGLSYEFSGNSLPASKSLTLTDGAVLNVTYDFEDDGTTGIIQISRSATLDAFGESAGEQTLAGINFSLSVPCTYVATITDVDPQQLEYAPFVSFSSSDGFADFQQNNNTATFAGAVSLEPCSLNELWSISSSPMDGGRTGSASSDITLTFTAIPEPSSVMMLFGSAVLLLKRPMRWTKVDISNA